MLVACEERLKNKMFVLASMLLLRCGVALDSWMFPLDEEIFPGVKQPIFFINSEKFQWIGNIIRMKKLDSAMIPRKMITIKSVIYYYFFHSPPQNIFLLHLIVLYNVLAGGQSIRASQISHFLLGTGLEGS